MNRNELTQTLANPVVEDGVTFDGETPVVFRSDMLGDMQVVSTTMENGIQVVEIDLVMGGEGEEEPFDNVVQMPPAINQ